jgi:magnesium transporter
MLRLIYRSILHFREHLRIINMISDELQSKIIKSMENSILVNMFTVEKSLETTSTRSLQQQPDRKAQAARRAHRLQRRRVGDSGRRDGREQPVRPSSRDIYSNILASLMDARASIVGNNLNVLMKTLNNITIAIMVPTFVVSAFSMNVTIRLQHHQFAFWIIMAMALVSVGSLSPSGGSPNTDG